MAVLENHGWAAASGAVKVQAITTDIHQMARWMEPRSIFLACTALIAQSEQGNDHERCDFNRKHDPEDASTIPCQIMAAAESCKNEPRADNKRHGYDQHNGPPHGVKTG